MDTKVVEKYQISPSQGGGAAAEQTLPLLYFDIVQLPIHHMQFLYFYNFPYSEPHFFTTTLPNLKNSLSLALKHFLPLAGKIIFPLNSGMPISHYSSDDKDSLSLTVAVSGSDFFLLTGNHPKDADDFHHLIPEIPSAVYSPDSVKFPVMAIQITLFPNQGVCIGVAFHHAICDGTALVCFLQTWASINKFNDENHLIALGRQVLPVYDRSAVQDSGKLTPLFWEMLKNSTPTVSSAISFPMHKLRATFVFSDEHVSELKNFLRLKKPGMSHVSSFTAVCARVWSCLASAAAREGVSDDEPEYFMMPVDCREKFKLALPSTYFGNCLSFVLAESAHGRLSGNGGFIVAAEAIGEAIGKGLKNEKGILDGCVELYLRIAELKVKKKRIVGVTGSPRFDLNGIDFGWGGGTKNLESLHIDVSGSISLSKSMEGIEVGISLPKLKMDAFLSNFNKNVFI